LIPTQEQEEVDEGSGAYSPVPDAEQQGPRQVTEIIRTGLLQGYSHTFELEPEEAEGSGGAYSPKEEEPKKRAPPERDMMSDPQAKRVKLGEGPGRTEGGEANSVPFEENLSDDVVMGESTPPLEHNGLLDSPSHQPLIGSSKSSRQSGTPPDDLGF
jgi:hypothetical protein